MLACFVLCYPSHFRLTFYRLNILAHFLGQNKLRVFVFQHLNKSLITLHWYSAFQLVKCSATSTIVTQIELALFPFKCTMFHTHIYQTNMLIFIGWVGLLTAEKLTLGCVVWLCWSRLATSEKCERAPVFPALSPSAIQPRGSGLPRASQKYHFHKIKSVRRRQDGRKVSPPYSSSALQLSNLTLRVSLYHRFLCFQHAGWWHHDRWLTDNLRCDVIWAIYRGYLAHFGRVGRSVPETPEIDARWDKKTEFDLGFFLKE